MLCILLMMSLSQFFSYCFLLLALYVCVELCVCVCCLKSVIQTKSEMTFLNYDLPVCTDYKNTDNEN